VITHRIAHLIHQHGVPPSAIAAVTFTKRRPTRCGSGWGRLLGDAYSLTGLVVATSIRSA